MKQVLATGKIRSPHGVKGFLKVQPYSDDIEHFYKLKEVILEKMGKQRKLEVEQVVYQGNGLLMKFKTIDSPEDARFISGWEILVPREQASKLKKGEVYTADLIGMKLLYDNEEVAVVESTMDGAQALLLEVVTPEGKKYLVPYMKGIFVDEVDVVKGTIVLLKKELLG
ncbi:MAG: 16S rRNA processing protein RimM [Sphaerochaetaceae bacterium]|nr:16S rRNA processing protein RimM [Sphaerochaetaceae bacterium]